MLDIFDDVLEQACKKETETSWILACDRPENAQVGVIMQISNSNSSHVMKFENETHFLC